MNVQRLIAIAAILVNGAILLACNPSEQQAAPEVAPTACALVDGEVTSNLIAAGHVVAFERGTWSIDGQVVGSAAAEDEDFSACGAPTLIAAVVEAQP